MDQRVAFGDHVARVPAVAVDFGEKGVFVSGRADYVRFFSGFGLRRLSAQRQKGAAAFLVILSRPLAGAVDIQLVSFQRVCDAGHFHAAVVDSAVALRGDPVFHFQFEIRRRPALPNDERIALQQRFRRHFADHAVSFDAPVNWVVFPAVQRFAVKNGREPGFRYVFVRERGLCAERFRHPAESGYTGRKKRFARRVAERERNRCHFGSVWVRGSQVCPCTG